LWIKMMMAVTPKMMGIKANCSMKLEKCPQFAGVLGDSL
jgi:hypothetical protein